jgi:nucleotide-binding universal stress UspA family protein
MTETSGPFTPPSIVVGVDGSRAAHHAALWALDEAVGRELPLRVVAAAEPGQAPGTAQSAVQAAVTAVTATGRQVTIDTEIIAGEPAAALLLASRAAAMLCIGAVGLKHFDHRGGSTVSSLVASAHCPVAVIRGGNRSGTVVVELDESPDSAAVLQAAVEEARLRAAPLRVLGTWQSADPDGRDTDERNRLVRSQLDRRLETWRHRYPDLDVEPVAVPGSGLEYLAAHAAATQLVVTGARNIAAVTELLGPAGLAALPDTSVLIIDTQRLL